MWLSLPAPVRRGGRRNLLGPSIVVVPSGSCEARRTEKLAWDLDCGHPFQPPEKQVVSMDCGCPFCPERGEGDGEDCLNHQLWSSLSVSAGPRGQRSLLKPRIVVVPCGLRWAEGTEKLVEAQDCGRPCRDAPILTTALVNYYLPRQTLSRPEPEKVPAAALTGS